MSWTFLILFTIKKIDFIVTLVASIYVIYYYSLAMYRIIKKEKNSLLNTFVKEDFNKFRAYLYFIYALLTVPIYITNFGINYIGNIIIAIALIITIIAMILLKKLENQISN